jgi:NADPH2:quinone reductase
MRCWLVERITDTGEMALRERPDPVVAADRYVIRVEAAGVNFSDTLMLRGRYQRKPDLPFVPGIEVVGTIIAAGAGTPLEPGQRICASVPTGGYAEFASVVAKAARVIPDDVPPDAALLLLGVNYPTAYYALHHRARIQPGETVLVHAAAGGVGSAAVQIALAHACRVIATAGTDDKRAICRQLGADAAIDYTADDWLDQVRAATGGEGADMIYDPVGGSIGAQSLRCLAWQGRLLVIGFAGETIPDPPANRLLLKDASALGVLWGEVKNRHPATAAAVADAVLALYRARKLDPVIGGRFPLAEARAALEQLGGRQTVGKVLLTPSGDDPSQRDRIIPQPL